MGNCATRPTEDVMVPREPLTPVKKMAMKMATTTGATVEIHAPPNSVFSVYFRYALHLKSVNFRLVPSQDNTLLIGGGEPLSGSRESLLRALEEKFPYPRHPRLVPAIGSLYRKEGSLLVLLLEGEITPLVVRLVALQHRSVAWHLERLVVWVEDLIRRGSGGGKTSKKVTKNAGHRMNPSVGNERMEIKKFSDSYNCLLEVLMEHAQMEERVVFPILDAADQGLCVAANEEHGRHFPIMNGIKEVIKSVLVLPIGTSDHQEALSDLLTRLKSLEKRCKDHFEEEQRDLLPLMEAVDLSKEQQQNMVERCIDLMQATHSRLFAYLIEGLLPWEVMLYLDLIIRCKEESQAVWILRRVID